MLSMPVNMNPTLLFERPRGAPLDFFYRNGADGAVAAADGAAPAVLFFLKIKSTEQ